MCNFLAHLYLSAPTGKAMIGNLMPDLVRGRVPDDLDAEVLAGVKIHRRVDAFTDTHPVPARTRGRLRDNHGIFAGILVDVFYDHILAADWSRWHDQPLLEFTAAAYARIASEADHMPESMRKVVALMGDEDWLGDYATIDRMAHILTRMSARFEHRFNRTFDAAVAVDDLASGIDETRADFNEFFPQLIAAVGVASRAMTDD